MYRTQDLQMVLRKQDELRREAAQHRLAARINTQEKQPRRTRRVLGLRLSFAW